MTDPALATQSAGELSHHAEELKRNRALFPRSKALGLPTAALFEPFQEARQLPELRRQLVAHKMQADLVEQLV